MNEKWFWITNNGKVNRISYEQYVEFQSKKEMKKTRLFLCIGRRFIYLIRGTGMVQLYGAEFDCFLELLLKNLEDIEKLKGDEKQ